MPEMHSLHIKIWDVKHLAGVIASQVMRVMRAVTGII